MIRHKENLQFTTIKELALPENRHEHILKDEIIELTGVQSIKKYTKRLRRVSIWDEKNEQVIELITNQRKWTANN